MRLTEQETMLSNAVREWVARNLLEKGYEYDAKGLIPNELRRDLITMGLWGISIPEAYGGGGASAVDSSLVAAELSFGLPAFHLSWSANNSLTGYPIIRFGTFGQKRAYLPNLASGAVLGCYALTEPDAGSDAASIKTAARFDKSNYSWVINGSKMFITNAHEASLGLIFARVSLDDALLYNSVVGKEETSPRVHMADLNHRAWQKKHAGITCFIVGSARPNGPLLSRKEGIEVNLISKWPMPSCHFSEIVFRDVSIGAEAILGKVGFGFSVAMETLNNGRVNIAAQAVGIARRALYEAEKYGSGRVAFGVPIIKMPKHARRLDILRKKASEAWRLTLEASRAKDSGGEYRVQAARAKLAASETALECAMFNLRLQGGFGQTEEAIAWRIAHDAFVTTIYEGTSDIQRLVIQKGAKVNSQVGLG